MLTLRQKLAAGVAAGPPRGRLILSYSERCRCRLLAWLDDGTAVGLRLPRGTMLRSGDRLLADSGEVVELVAADEAVYRVTATVGSADPGFDLLRAAYHLGNRHVPLQLSPKVLRLEPDPVLKELLLRLGLDVADALEPFEPEPGAYGGGHRHDHDTLSGALGEQLSREAHARQAPDYAALRFQRG